MIAALSLVLGLNTGAAATVLLHAGYGRPRGFWQRQLCSTRARYANLPVGGLLALGAADAMLGAGHPGAAHAAVWAGAGMTLAAIGGALLDPLPRSTP